MHVIFNLKKSLIKLLIILLLLFFLALIISSSWPNKRAVEVIPFPPIYLSETSNVEE